MSTDAHFSEKTVSVVGIGVGQVNRYVSLTQMYCCHGSQTVGMWLYMTVIGRSSRGMGNRQIVISISLVVALQRPFLQLSLGLHIVTVLHVDKVSLLGRSCGSLPHLELVALELSEDTVRTNKFGN